MEELPEVREAGEVEMNGLTFSGLREVNVTRCKRWHPPESTPWTSADWSNALCGEAGELANVIKKLRRHETGARNEGDPTVEQLTVMAGAELADVVIYADLVAHHLGIDLGAAIADKFNKVSRKYGFPERLAETLP
jgi:NTP pyrophosphatase (non-canonical NTP hydrolase)